MDMLPKEKVTESKAVEGKDTVTIHTTQDMRYDSIVMSYIMVDYSSIISLKAK